MNAELTKFDPATVRAVTQYKCLNKMSFFTRYMFKNMENKKFRHAEHADIIFEALERVLSGKCKRLIINIAPRFGKTELAVKYLVAHALALNPAAKFIHLSYSNSLALDNSEHIRDLVTSAEYQELFPDVQVKKDSKAKNKWHTTAGGGVYATSASGQVTGFGAGTTDEEERPMSPEEEAELQETINELITSIDGVHTIDRKRTFGGAIIIDDPIKPDDADSEVVRGRVNNRFDSTIRSRVNSETNTPIIIIMQRLHPQDLAGYLQDSEPGVWEVISLPAIKEDGTALCPWRLSIEQCLAKRAANELVWERQYMQNPKPREGLLFPKEDLQFMDMSKVPLKKAEYRHGFVDVADEGADYLSMPIAYLIGNKIYFPGVVYNQDDTGKNEPRLVEEIIFHRLNSVDIETNGGFGTFAKDVRHKVRNPPEEGGRGYAECQIRSIKATTNKHSRIWAESAWVKLYCVFDINYYNNKEYRAFIDCLCSYMKNQEGSNKNKHDDAPDSMAGIAKFFKSRFGHLWNPPINTQENES